MMMSWTRILVAASMLLVAGPARAQLSDAEMVALLEKIDDRQRNSGDYTSLVYIEQKEKGKADLLYEAVVYRREFRSQTLGHLHGIPGMGDKL